MTDLVDIRLIQKIAAEVNRSEEAHSYDDIKEIHDHLSGRLGRPPRSLEQECAFFEQARLDFELFMGQVAT